MEIEYFKVLKQTKRFNKNQTVFVRFNMANHMHIYFKWRGKGRYVQGTIDKFATCVGKIKKMNVEDAFAKKVMGEYIQYYEGGEEKI